MAQHMSWKQMTYWSVFLSMASLKSLFGMFHYYSKTQYWDFSGVQWLRLWAPNAGGLGSIPSLGTKSHILQLWVQVPQLQILHAHWRQKIPRATTKTQHSPLTPPPKHNPDCSPRNQLSGHSRPLAWILSPLFSEISTFHLPAPAGFPVSPSGGPLCLLSSRDSIQTAVW